MKKSIALLVIAASVFAAPSAMAEKGKWEMSIAGNVENSTSKTKVNGTSTGSTDSTNTFINVDVGRYFTSKLVGRVDLSMFGTDSGGTSSVGTAIGVGVKYYFGEAAKSAWVPFVNGGVSVVGLSAKSAGTTTTFSGAGLVGGGGVSYFISEDVSADLSIQAFANSMTGSSVDLNQSGTRVLFGLTGRF
jgi:outer membrane protein W